jgi:hypothetical protein
LRNIFGPFPATSATKACILVNKIVKTSKRNAAPLSTVSDDDSEPTAKKQSGFLIYSFANLFFLVIL